MVRNKIQSLKGQKGFTIIEVMIVLAIAGLILLIVFLAVPALQRNQRNTGRKNDIGRIGGAASEYLSNNNGAVPSTVANAQTIADNAGSLSQYTLTTTGTVTFSVVAGAASVANPDDYNNIKLVTGAVCGSGGVATNSGASSRAMVLLYTTEAANGGKNDLCQPV